MTVSIQDLKTRAGVLRYPNQAAAILANSYYPWSPANLASCRIFLDARNKETLWRDDGATTPVENNGDPVGNWYDSTLNNTTFNQSSNLPSYHVENGIPSVLWSGSARGLIQSALNLSSTAVVTTVTAVKKLSDAALARIASFGSAQPLFAVSAPPAATPTFGSNVSGGTARSVTSVASFPAPVKAIVTTVSRINAGTPSSRIRVNGGAWVDEALGAGATANFGTAVYAIGANTVGTGELFNGHIYAHALFTAELSMMDLLNVELYMASLCDLRF